MLCYIYKSQKKEELYVYLNTQDDFSSLPDDLIRQLGKLSFVMELELTPDKKLARENAEKVIFALQSRGFFIQMPPTIMPLGPQVAKTHIH
ncbi:MAG: YcgL domain-containing protein [Methylococcaceae bacterium]|jgi:uncharacterized protein YcgL (UPF0745 family)|nr:YcgL domain-containing protein [Methylococcaceae bacterium]